MSTEIKTKAISLLDPPVYPPIDFNKSYNDLPQKDKFAIRNSKTKKKPKPKVIEEFKPVIKVQSGTPPKQQIINFFENRDYLYWELFDDEHFWYGEVLWAEEFATKSLMEDLLQSSFHYHFSPRNNRLRVYAEKIKDTE